MKLLIFILILLFTNTIYTQHTDRFLELTKVLKKVDSKTDTLFYGNGKIYYVSTITTYEYDGGIAENYTGLSTIFYRNGNISSTTQQDDYGNYLLIKIFDKKGNLIEERITTKIDNRAKNITEYLNDISYGDYEKTVNYYKYSKNNGSWYKYKVVYLKLVNSKGVEIRNIFDENGKLIKTKSKDYRI
tara:strand:+ start:93 stop:653 length:561 start_codon:yes stop_codon:yes gene_type:complete